MKADHLDYSLCLADMICEKKRLLGDITPTVEVSPTLGSSRFSQQLRTAVQVVPTVMYGREGNPGAWDSGKIR